MDRDIATVRDIRARVVDGRNVETITFAIGAGTPKSVEILRQDLPENADVIAGSALDPDDQTTPGFEIATRGA